MWRVMKCTESTSAKTIMTAHLARFLLALSRCLSSMEIWAPDVWDAAGWSPTVCHPKAQELEPKQALTYWSQTFPDNRATLRANDHVLNGENSGAQKLTHLKKYARIFKLLSVLLPRVCENCEFFSCYILCRTISFRPSKSFSLKSG